MTAHDVLNMNFVTSVFLLVGERTLLLCVLLYLLNIQVGIRSFTAEFIFTAPGHEHLDAYFLHDLNTFGTFSLQKLKKILHKIQ